MRTGSLVYIAGPLFTDGDRWYLERIQATCAAKRLKTFLPHIDAGLCESNHSNTQHFFQSDRANLDLASLVVAVLHGTDVDSGTAWELGYAFARGLDILCVADDIRIAGRIENINLMIANSSKVVFSYADLEAAIEAWVERRGLGQ